MSQAVIAGLRASFEHAYGLMAQFADLCPEEVWAEKFGGWPVWQHVHHALGGFQFWVLQDGETPEQGPFPPEVSRLQSIPDTAPAKKTVLDFAARMKARADVYIDALQDANLSDINQGLTSRMKAHGVQREFSHAQTLAMLTGHVMYHLGACDSALRARGLKGVF